MSGPWEAEFLPSLDRRDALFTNASIVDVITQTVYEGWFTVEGGRFVEVEAGAPTEADLAGLSIGARHDLGGAFVQPGMIDAHMHIESSMVTPRRFAEAALPHGTTTILQDPHEVANVAGAEGIRWMIRASQGLQQRVYSAISSCVPATSPELETPNASLLPADVMELANETGVIALGEMMDYQGLVAGDARPRSIVAAGKAAGLGVEGHVPSLSGVQLSRYVAHGIRSDHTLASAEKVLEELRKGLWVMIQEKSLIPEVIEALVALPDRSRVILITDDVLPGRLVRGHMSRLVRRAVERGWPALDALASATLRPATYLGIGDLGTVAPGARADFLVTDELALFPPAAVYVAGELTVDAGRVVPPTAERPAVKLPELPQPDWAKGRVTADSFRFAGLGTGSGRVSVTARVIRTNKTNSFTTLHEAQVELVDGVPTDEDLALACVIPREDLVAGAELPKPVMCLVAGTGLRHGGYASSFAHDSHNVFLFGRSPEAMLAALDAVIDAAGAMAFVSDGGLEIVELPFLGLLSDEPASVVGDKLNSLKAALVAAGMDVLTPVLLLTLLPLSVSPDFKVTDKGVIDVQGRRILGPVVA